MIPTPSAFIKADGAVDHFRLVCGEPAVYRAFLRSADTWIVFCEEHAALVEELRGLVRDRGRSRAGFYDELLRALGPLEPMDEL